ncbi:MAG: type II toxin-antitoxin system VapC family toxin [Thermomicrobiales bacterium]
MDQDRDVARENWPNPPPEISEPSNLGLEEAQPPSNPEDLTIFIDSSALVALVDRDDAAHATMVEAYRQLVDEGYRMFTSNYVVTETFDLLMAGVGPAIARQWLRYSKLAVYHADEQDVRKARQETLRATSGHGLTLTDAVSLTVMKRLNVVDALAADPNFLADGS